MTTPYSYCILRYHHDPSTGEAVNIGILLLAPTSGFVRFKSTTRTHALSALFRGFNRDQFLRFLDALESATKRLQDLLDNSRTEFNTGQTRMFEEQFANADAGANLVSRFLRVETPSLPTAEAAAAWLLPDNGLSLQFSEARGGITRDVLTTHQTLFDRLITHQRPPQKERKRRDNEDVWTVFQKSLKEYGITNHLGPHTVQIPQFDDPIPFKHAYKNERWHAVEPMSFDYADSSSIREQAFRWYGYGAALKQVAEFDQLYILLGAPGDAAQKKEYAGAKTWLSRMENRPQLVEEDEAPDFASELASTMQKEGILPPKVEASDTTVTLEPQRT